MLFLTPKCFTFVNIEWGSGVFQGIVAAVQSRPQTLKQFVQVSSPFPFSMLFLTPKCFTFVNIEWGSGVFQGIVAAVVASENLLWLVKIKPLTSHLATKLKS